MVNCTSAQRFCHQTALFPPLSSPHCMSEPARLEACFTRWLLPVQEEGVRKSNWHGVCVWFHHLCIGSPCIFINCVCVSRGGVLIMRVWDVKYMNHETSAGTRLMECVCGGGGCFNSELISFGKKKGVWYRKHTLLRVWYVVRKLHVH